MSLNLTASAKAKNAIILVCGCPRSGTTHIAQKIFDCIRAKDNNIQYYIELNPQVFVMPAEKYWQHKFQHSKKTRALTVSEKSSRFALSKKIFQEHDLDLISRFKTLFLKDGIALFKYPTLMQSREFRVLLSILLDHSVNVYLMWCVRDSDETFKSFQRRNLYFSKTSMLCGYLSKLLINDYNDIAKKLPGNSISLNSEISIETIERTKINKDIFNIINEHFKLSFRTIRRTLFLRMVILIRNKLLKKDYW